ncbi:hypothetical protein M9H77_36507 [Catharanthus roseus]|uniref:Uncharacterized protein n=1 Tax=Catharanthus roseus TaxID=4058 RepID=A0ACB9ZU69_CATRO|nr:hypothetical protein M9H77_36507 [Catharanthus roseus]
MEEVPAYVHPGPIVPDVLSRQHEHRSGLIWSGDHETHFSVYKVKKEPLEAWILRAITSSETDDDLILCARGFIFLLTYSWGSYVLGFLYRQLRLSLTTIWAWSRIPALRPQLITDIQADPLAPQGTIWCTSFDCSQLPTHTLMTYKDQLDFMPSDQFIWLPYLDCALVPSDLWWAEVPLICYEIVEYHYPRRVIR